MEIPILKDIVIIFGFSVVVVYLFSKIKLPPIVGFLLTGVIAGPHGFGLIHSEHEVEILAEIGVILILFTIGIEFSIQRLLQVKKTILVGGSVQVIGTISVVYLIAIAFGLEANVALFAGFLLALSSTAIVLNLLQTNGEIDTPKGKITLSILIYQDLIIIPMMLLAPVLAGQSNQNGDGLFLILAKISGIILFVILATRFLMPWLMYQIARTRIRELFLLGTLLVCLFVVWLSSEAGLSVALGAFLAGLIISETEYNHQALGSIIPFKDVFSSFFFVSVGMLLNSSFLIDNLLVISLVFVAILVLKFFTGTAAGLILKFPARIAILTGIALSQVGEFSFVLSKTGLDFGLIDSNFYQYFLAVTVISMAATPLLFNLSPWINKTLIKIGFKREVVEDRISKKKNHIIIIGFGLNGRNIAKVAKATGIEYEIIDTNPETYRTEKKKGEPITFGDACSEEVLMHSGIKTAKVVVIAISDATATRAITRTIKSYNPSLFLLVRTRYQSEVSPLYELGADEVIPEEFETSIELFTRVLFKYMIPKQEIDRFISEVRSDGYEMLRTVSRKSKIEDIKSSLAGHEIVSIRIENVHHLDNKTLKELDLRGNHGITVLAIERGRETIINPPADFQLELKDVCIFFGKTENINSFIRDID